MPAGRLDSLLCQHSGVVSPGSQVLTSTVEAFVQPLAEVVDTLAKRTGRSDGSSTDDVTIEAFNLCCAVVDADGRHTDDELWALLATFGPRFPTQLALAAPDDVRRAGLLVGKRAWLDTPSALFDLLLHADVRDGTTHAWTYYANAIALAQLVVALDAKPTQTELTALDAFRTMCVHTIEGQGIARPGSGVRPTPPSRSTKGTPAAPGTAGTPAASTGAPTPTPKEPDPLPPPEPIDDLLAELDALVGLAGVKSEVKLVTNLLQIQKLRKEHDLPVVESSRHLVFTGNPGTGKTTVARLLAKIYRSLGVVERGQLVETDRARLVAGFVGQTAIKVTEVFDEADGGILLIDEAYALARGGPNDFGREAIDTIVKLIEDRRDRIAVIVAGYPDEMNEFLDANPGLRSRFPKVIPFADYSDDELLAIFQSLCKKNRYEPTPDAVIRLRAYFADQPRTKGFGNGRLARNAFESAVARQASRLMANGGTPELSSEQLQCLEAVDIAEVPAAAGASAGTSESTPSADTAPSVEGTPPQP